MTKLAKVTLTFSEGQKVLELDPDGVTIFVGPNGSGKSLALREIERQISDGQEPQTKLVTSVDFDWPTEEEVIEFLEESIDFANRKLANNLAVPRLVPGKEGNFSTNLDLAILRNVLKAKSNKRYVAHTYVSFFQVRLDGRTRFELTNDQAGGDLLQPTNMFSRIFTDDPTRLKIRNFIYDAIGKYFVIDPTATKLRIRLSSVPPIADEQSLNAAARSFHSNSLYIKEASDGVQAYVGIITAATAGKFRILLIDEPEAFLHPPLARKLGGQLASLAADRKGSLFAATHSGDFVVGCILSGKPVQIVRLEYSEGKSKGKLISSDEIKSAFLNPLMRSANVLSALFYDGVVITESDNDRVFYSEIYHRISESESNTPSILFVNAQNKQTIKKMIEPLRRFGIPAAAIPDIDVIKDGGQEWSDWLSSIMYPSVLHPGMATTRSHLQKLFESSGRDMKRGGIGLLDPAQQSAFEVFAGGLAEYGMFVVPFGELESWLPELAVSRTKAKFALEAIVALGEDPASTGYAKPSDNDVWAFMRKIIEWVRNPARKGTG